MFNIIDWIFRMLLSIVNVIFTFMAKVGVYIVIVGFILYTLFTVLF
mgnify:CR=1